MPDTVRQKIINAIDARLKTILVTGAYKTNLGSNVFAWRATPFEESELPALNYRDTTESRIPGAGVYDLTLTVFIEVFSTTMTELRQCLADIEKAIFVDETWGDLALNSEIGPEEIQIGQNENIFVASEIALIVEYRTVRGDAETNA
jgi:hypothetical protein